MRGLVACRSHRAPDRYPGRFRAQSTATNALLNVRLLTKGGHDWTDRYPWIVETTRKLKQDQFVLDGEAVVLNVDGMSDFTALQSLFTGTFAGETILIQAPWASNAAWTTDPQSSSKAGWGSSPPPNGDRLLISPKCSHAP